jgi:hypothetical protein
MRSTEQIKPAQHWRGLTKLKISFDLTSTSFLELFFSKFSEFLIISLRPRAFLSLD